MPFYKSLVDTSWLDPERASVFDPLYKRVTRKVANLMGYEGRPEEMVQLPSPMAAVAGPATAVARAVAPKRVAKELADVLMGRSKRVPPARIYDKIPEADISLQAMMESRVGGSRVPPPTTIKMSRSTGLTIPGKGQVDRPKELTEQFKVWQRAMRDDPGKTTYKTITADTKGAGTTVLKNPHIGSGMKDVARNAGSVQQAVKGGPLKIMTEKELQALIDGPRKAMELGGLTAEQGRAVLAKNKQRIDDYFNQLQSLKHAKYDEAMKHRIETRYLGVGSKNGGNAINPESYLRR